MRRLAPKTEEELKDVITRFPLKTNVQIANELQCNKMTVAKYRKIIDESYDREFVKIVAGKWIKYYGMAANLLFKYISQIEEYKETGKKTIITKEGDKEIPLSGMEKGQLTKIQSDILTKLCEDAGNGEVREVIRMLRNGKIPNYT